MKLVLVAFYIGISPVYWFPGISYTTISNVKYVIVFCLLLMSVNGFLKGGPARKILFGIGACAVCAFLSIYLNSGFEKAVDRTRDFLQPIAWLGILFSFSQEKFPKLLLAVSVGLLVFFAFALYGLLASLSLVPNLMVPADVIYLLGDGYEYKIGHSSVANSGFNSGHTGWGPPVAVSSLALASIIISNRKGFMGPLMGAAILVVGLIAVVMVGARGAALAMIIGVGFWFLTNPRSQIAFIVGVFVAVGSAASFDVSAMVPERFFKQAIDGDFIARLDAISTGRITTYEHGIKAFVSSPVIGVGVEAARVELRGGLEVVDVHNLWLRAAAEGGLILLLPLAWSTAQLFEILKRRRYRGASAVRLRVESRENTLTPALICAFAMSLIEPGIFFGPFNNNVQIWTVIGLTIIIARAKVYRLDQNYVSGGAVSHFQEGAIR